MGRYKSKAFRKLGKAGILLCCSFEMYCIIIAFGRTVQKPTSKKRTQVRCRLERSCGAMLEYGLHQSCVCSDVLLFVEGIEAIIVEPSTREIDRSVHEATQWSDCFEPRRPAYRVFSPRRAVKRRSSSNVADPKPKVCGADADLAQPRAYSR